MRVLLLPLALALAACGRSDREGVSSTQSGSLSAGNTGPQSLVVRLPRAGGTPRVHVYPRLDSVVWASTDRAPAPGRLLAFDDENGVVAYEDQRGRPVFLELRLGTVTVASTKKLTGLASANGKSIYGITATGSVVRMTAAAEWTYKPPSAARAVFPQPDGGLLVATGTGANTRLLKLFPPEERVLDSIPFPVASKTVRTQLGDRLVLAVDSGIVILRTRTMDWAPPVHFDEPITVMASTPSGDRVFVLGDSGNKVSVVDRFRDRVTAEFELPGRAEDLRVDPFGRYVLARAAEGDSIWVLAIGTQRVIGGLRGAWRADLPFVGYDGAVAIASAGDVVLYDGETLKERSRVRDGARDTWYPILWDGFRPRSASLDEPVVFDSIPLDTTPPDSTTLDTTGLREPSRQPESPEPEAHGFIVSFAAFLNPERARELAGRIRVGGENARITSSTRDGAVIYRVILGPFVTREEAERAGRESGHQFWVYEGNP